MATGISYHLLGFFSSLDYFAAAFLFSFLIWEIVRFSKIFDQKWVADIFPEGGNIVDYVLLLVGLISFVFIKLNQKTLLLAPHKPMLNIVFTIALLILPVIIFLGLAGRFFSRMDSKMAFSAFVVNFILDFVHCMFHVCFGAIVLSAGALLFLLFM